MEKVGLELEAFWLRGGLFFTPKVFGWVWTWAGSWRVRGIGEAREALQAVIPVRDAKEKGGKWDQMTTGLPLLGDCPDSMHWIPNPAWWDRWGWRASQSQVASSLSPEWWAGVGQSSQAKEISRAHLKTWELFNQAGPSRVWFKVRLWQGGEGPYKPH